MSFQVVITEEYHTLQAFELPCMYPSYIRRSMLVASVDR